MMANIALLLTIAFVLLVFKLDVRRKSTASYALWIPVIWMIYSAARPVSFWLTGNPSITAKEVIEGSPIDRAILSALTILGIYVLSRRNIKWSAIFKNNVFIIFWFLYCGISILWSDFPMVSFKRWVKEIGLLSGVLIVLTEAEPIDAVKTLIKRFSYLLISFSILLIVYFPKLGMTSLSVTGIVGYAGVGDNKNSLARICLIAGFFLFCNLIAMRRTNKTGNDKENTFIQFVFLIMTVWLLIIADSATSLGAFLIGIILFVGFGLRFVRKKMEYLGTIVIVSFIVCFILSISVDIIGWFVTSQGRDMTLTGRTLLWKDLLAFRTNPLIGVGYGSFWLGDRLAILWDTYTWMPNESHNGYLNVYLELGYIGLSLLVGVVYCAYQNIKKELTYNFDYGRFRMGILFIALLYNVTEDAFGQMTLLWFVFLLVSFDIPRQSSSENYPSNRK